MASPMLAPMIKFRYTNNNGFALVGGKVYTSVSGTNTPLATYADPNGDAFNTNPIILDARGEADIWLQPGKKYRFTIKDSNDVVIDITDKIIGASAAAIDPGAVSILTYGADPTGVTDSAASIAAAMAAASDANTVIFAPAGTYKVLSTITMVGAPNCRGIIGEGSESTIFDFSGITSGDGFHLNNTLQGSRYMDFKVIGPGKAAPFVSTGMNFVSDGLGEFQGITESVFKRIKVTLFPTDGFRWEVPYVDIMEELYAVECGRRGFFIDTVYNPWVAGTSTNFSSCWALSCGETGFWFEPHVYSALNSCACDHTPVGYRFNGCTGMTFNACGYETGLDSPGTSGIALWLDAPSGVVDGASFANNITGLWAYNFNPAVTTFLLAHIEKGSYNTFENCYVLNEGTLPAEDVVVTTDSSYNRFINCTNTSSPDGRIRVSNSGTANSIQYGSEVVNGLSFTGSNVYGNSIETVGSIVVSSDTYAALALYTAGEDFPRLSLDNGGTIAFASGTADFDTKLVRWSPGELTVTNADDTGGNLNVIGNIYAGADITATGNASVLGEITVGTNATVDADLTVAGSSTLNDVSVTGTTQIANISFSNATAISSSNVTLTGWDTTTINYASGNNTAGSIGLNALGTPGANPTVRVTYQSPVPAEYSFIPSVFVSGYAQLPNVGHWVVINQTATYFEVMYVGTPSGGWFAGFNYLVYNL